MNKTPILLAFAVLCFAQTSLAQSRFNHQPTYYHDAEPSDNMPDIFTIGLGFGQDYGGIGLNATVYPQKNIGIFAGAGTAIAGFGYNVGLKYRFLPNGGDSKVRPFIEGMYGYTAAVSVSGASDLNKVFYGPSFGAGIDIGSTVHKKGYFSLAILVPIRGSDVQNYIDYLRANGVDVHDLIPITFSIGYKFIIN